MRAAYGKKRAKREKSVETGEAEKTIRTGKCWKSRAVSVKQGGIFWEK
jgi:hypothetical protein